MLSLNEQLGMRIVYLRKLRHWSQEELAFRAQINKNYLSDLENGRRNPSLALINRLAVALEIPLSELFKGLEDLQIE